MGRKPRKRKPVVPKYCRKCLAEILNRASNAKYCLDCLPGRLRERQLCIRQTEKSKSNRQEYGIEYRKRSKSIIQARVYQLKYNHREDIKEKKREHYRQPHIKIKRKAHANLPEVKARSNEVRRLRNAERRSEREEKKRSVALSQKQQHQVVTARKEHRNNVQRWNRAIGNNKFEFTVIEITSDECLRACLWIAQQQGKEKPTQGGLSIS